MTHLVINDFAPLLLNAPNPACCNTDEPGHLCPRCRAAYEGAAPHYRGAAAPLGNGAAGDRDDYLPLPTMNFEGVDGPGEGERKAARERRQRAWDRHYGRDEEENRRLVEEENRRRLALNADLLPLPTVDWSAAAEEQRAADRVTANRSRGDDGGCGVPGLSMPVML